MRIGVDFDNTIVCFDPLFYAAAVEKKLIPSDLPNSKTRVRDYLRSDGREEDWTRLQGVVYGEKIRVAQPFPGVKSFFLTATQKGHDVFVVSHKTEYSALEPRYNLHAPARAWLESQAFYSTAGLRSANVYFETSMQLKSARIADLKCDLFIDDLLEFLTRPDLPEKTRRVLFDPHRQHLDSALERVDSWTELEQRCLN